MTKSEKTLQFDPNSAGLKDSNIFGLPFNEEESDIILLPVPWEVTTSYGEGTSNGPSHILEASFQVDLYQPDFPDLWKRGIAMTDIPEDMLIRSMDLKRKASFIIDLHEDGVDVRADDKAQQILAEINIACEKMNQLVQQHAEKWLSQNKLVGLIGGDHSTPLGFLRALALRHENFGILHIDAHMDLRDSYEGFEYSHASIMFNALKISEITKLVSVGIRDFCEAEANVVTQENGRVIIFTEASLQRERFIGKTWHQQCENIISKLPQKVYISFDIDGLDPTLCPNTGTPVPGGLGFDQATYLLHCLKNSGKQIIGFDLVEVAPGNDDWNGNVGARLLFQLCGVMVG